MKTTRVRHSVAIAPWRVAASALVASVVLAAFAPDVHAADYVKTVRGFAIYIGVIPAQIVRGHPRARPEGAMHGGAAKGRDAYHLVVAVFDAASGARIDDAPVSARVGEPGLAPVAKRLEPMPIAGAMSYGNDFAMPDAGPYRIDLRIARPGPGNAVDVTFTHTHPR
jgi:hypothetical protein